MLLVLAALIAGIVALGFALGPFGDGEGHSGGERSQTSEPGSSLPLTEAVVTQLADDLSSGEQGGVLQALTIDHAGLPTDVAAQLAGQGGIQFDVESLVDYGDGSGVVEGSVGEQAWRFLLIIQEGVWRVSATVSLP